MTNDLDRRIAQFKNMAEADPNNELGHFSLGKAYFEAGRFADASASLARALELNPGLSKAYQLRGESLNISGNRVKAIEIFTRGVEVADEQGDHMPRDAMVKFLKELGAPIPTLRAATAAGSRAPSVGGGTAAGFRCSRCGRPNEAIDRPPFKGPLGLKIAANVCKSCWREWIGMGTKVINELGLQMNQPEAQEAYDTHMVEFLQLAEK